MFSVALSGALRVADRLFGPFVNAIGGALSGIGAKLAANGALMSGIDKLGQLMGSRLGTVMKGLAVLALAAIAVEQWGQLQQQIDANKKDALNLDTETANFLAGLPSRDEVQARLAALEAIPDQLDPLKRALFETHGIAGILGADPKDAWQKQVDAIVRFLRDLKASWELVGEWERAKLVQSVYDKVIVSDREVVEVELTDNAKCHGLACALPGELRVALARPAGARHTQTTLVRVPIHGKAQWLESTRKRSAS